MERNREDLNSNINFYQKNQLNELQDQINSFKDKLVKLKTHEAFLFDCFRWKYRDSYLKLCASFLNQNISGDEFSEQIFVMQFNHSKGFNELMDQLESNIEFLNKLNLDNNVVEFGDIVDSLEQNCDSYVSDETLLELLKMGEGAEIHFLA